MNRNSSLSVVTALVVTLALVSGAIMLSAQNPARPAAAAAPAAAQAAQYVGSAACASCHQDQYQRWSKTRMANVVLDPKTHPDAIIPDMSKPDPLVTFKKEDIAFVYGSKWKQRYFTKVGDDYFPLGAQWDVQHKIWRAYQVANGTDWWIEYYPGGNATRPTGPLCDGCHSVNYNIQTKTVTEWNVGCERCHGPGSAHVARPIAANIVNPSKLDSIRRQRYLHSVPFAGPAQSESNQREILRLARGISHGFELE